MPLNEKLTIATNHDVNVEALRAFVAAIPGDGDEVRGEKSKNGAITLYSKNTNATLSLAQKLLRKVPTLGRTRRLQHAKTAIARVIPGFPVGGGAVTKRSLQAFLDNGDGAASAVGPARASVATPPQPAYRPVTIGDILQSQQLRDSFMAYCRQQHMAEQFEFVLDAGRYATRHGEISAEERATQACALCQTYVVAGADKSINVDPNTRNLIQNDIKEQNFGQNLFAAARVKIIDEVLAGIVPEFNHSLRRAKPTPS